MEGIDYLEDALKAMNTGAANLNSKTLAQINAMNIELKNADGSLAGKYKLSEFLENVIYSYLSTTKASSLASVLGGILPFGKVSDNASILSIKEQGAYLKTGSSINVSGVPTDIGDHSFCLLTFLCAVSSVTMLFLLIDAVNGKAYINFKWDGNWLGWKTITP